MKIDKSTREAYGDALAELGEENKDIIVITADLAGSTKTSVFLKKFPERHFDAGIAENNMTGMAAGMASCGKTVFISTFAVFGTGRNYDAIRNLIAHTGLNVKLAMTHSGLTVGEDGATHQSLEDIALMNALPNIKIFVPADYTEAKEAVKAAAEIDGPVYIRLGRNAQPAVFDEDYTFTPGKSFVCQDGKDAAIFACGIMVAKALEAREMLLKEGIDAAVINVSSIKPFDVDTLINYAKKTTRILTCEEHSINGGLNSIVCRYICEEGLSCKVGAVAVMERFGQSGRAEEVLQAYEMTAQKIAEEVKKLL